MGSVDHAIEFLPDCFWKVGLDCKSDRLDVGGDAPLSGDAVFLRRNESLRRAFADGDHFSIIDQLDRSDCGAFL